MLLVSGYIFGETAAAFPVTAGSLGFLPAGPRRITLFQRGPNVSGIETQSNEY
jgi:hypothetical protein